MSVIMIKGCNIPYTKNCINVALLLISLLFILNPNFYIFPIPYSIKIPILTLWYVWVLFTDIKHFRLINNIVISALTMFLYELILYFIGYSTASIGNYFNLFVYFDVIIKSFYVYYAYSPKMKFYLFRIFQVVVVGLCYYYYEYGMLVQSLYEVGGGSFVAQNIGEKISNTSFYNMLIFYIGVNIYKLLFEENYILKLLDLLCIIIPIAFMLLIETRATSFIFSCILIIVIFVIYKRKIVSKKGIIRSYIYILLCLLVLFAFSKDIIINILPERVAVRLQSLVEISSGGNVSQYAELGRFELSMNSIKTWLSSFVSFILGVGSHSGKEYWGVIGQHALYVDMLAQYGLVGALLLYSVFKQIYLGINRFKSSIPYDSSIENALFLCYLALGFVSDTRNDIVAFSVFFSVIAIYSNNNPMTESNS